MSQSEVMVAALLGAFVLFLLMKNRLQTYWALLTGGGASAGQAAANAASSNAPPVTSTTPPANPSTSAGNVSSFIPGTVQQMGNLWSWMAPNNATPQYGFTPPPGYVPPAPATTPPTTGGSAPNTGSGY